MKKAIKAILLMLTVVTAANAQQKIGYLNAQAILADMTDMKAADSQLEAYAKQLTAKDSIMVVSFQAKAQKLGEDQQKGLLAPIALEAEKKKLEAEKAQIEEFEQKMQQDLADRRKTLYQPVLDKVNKAIQDVAKEQAFTYVVDLTAGSLLYADEKNDLQNAVRTKLGLPAAATIPVGKN
ncbi:MAG: OmpH family outer membrane protein [Saprospiraceae bacterium]|nr:OmpH family outer membrane protein [Saprospiraceae bacterium]